MLISAEDAIEGPWNGLRIQIATPQYFPAMVDCIRRSFVTDEPLGQCMGYDDDFANDLCGYFDEALDDDNRHSLVAIDEVTQQVVGVRICKLEIRGHQHPSGQVGRKLQNVFDLMEHLEKQAWGSKTIFEAYGVDQFVEFKALAVDAPYRQMKLGFELILRTMRLVKKLKIPLIRSFFSSRFSRRIGEKVGMELVFEQMYDTYEREGTVVFPNMGQHNSMTMMVFINKV